MSVLVDAGYLTETDLIEGGAAELFFLHRDKIIQEEKLKNPIYADIPQGKDIRDSSFYPTFHDNWISGILRTCLLILNVKPGVRNNYKNTFFAKTPAPLPGPIHDPWYVYEKMIIPDPALPTVVITPKLTTADELKAYFSLPQLLGETKLISDLVVPPDVSPNLIPQTNFKLRLANLIEKGPVDIVEIVPAVSSDAFPDLDYGNNLSLADKQKNLATSVVKSFEDLNSVVESDPDTYLVPIGLLSIDGGDASSEFPGLGLVPIFNKTKEILKNNFGTYAAVEEPDIAITNQLNYEALKRTLIKPLYLSVIGSMFGSSQKGFIAKMQSIAPDAVGILNENKDFKVDPTPVVYDYIEKINTQLQTSSTSNESLVYTVSSDFPYKPGNPKYGIHLFPVEARKKLIEICKNLPNKGIPFDPDWLVYTMSIETGFTFNPAIKNKESGATGLIQFMKPTATTLGTTQAALAAMSAVEQLDYVFKYFEIFLKSSPAIKSTVDCYLAVFSPEFIRNSNFTYKAPSLDYDQNKNFDTADPKGVIQKHEIAAVVSGLKYVAEKQGTRIKVDNNDIIQVDPTYYTGKS